MIDIQIHTSNHSTITFSYDSVQYDPNKPKIKDLLWNHYNWFVEMDQQKMARSCILDNVQKVLLCNTSFLGYDAFEFPDCDNFLIMNHKCHSRFCTSCGVKYQKKLAAKAECRRNFGTQMSLSS